MSTPRTGRPLFRLRLTIGQFPQIAGCVGVSECVVCVVAPSVQGCRCSVGITRRQVRVGCCLQCSVARGLGCAHKCVAWVVHINMLRERSGYPRRPMISSLRHLKLATPATESKTSARGSMVALSMRTLTSYAARYPVQSSGLCLRASRCSQASQSAGRHYRPVLQLDPDLGPRRPGVMIVDHLQTNPSPYMYVSQQPWVTCTSPLRQWTAPWTIGRGFH